MKCILLLCAAIAAATAAPSQQASLIQDFRDFMAVIPMDKIRKTVSRHLQNDPEFQAGIGYLQSDQWRKIKRNLYHKPSVKEARLIIKEGGLDTEMYEGLMDAFLQTLDVDVDRDQRRSFKSFFAEANDLMPWDDVMDLLVRKLETSSAFRTFYNAISSEHMHKLVDKALISEEYRVLSKELISMDVPVNEVREAAYAIFGWKNYNQQPNDLDD